MKIRIIKLQKKDFNDFVLLINKLADHVGGTPPTPQAIKRLYKHAFCTHPLYEPYIIKLGITNVGYILTYMTYSSFLALPTLYIEDIYIANEYRGIGVGTAVMDFCKKIAKKRKCGRIDWVAVDTNKSAIKFYKNRGATILKKTNFRITL